jgi:hypothetical protein
LYPDGYGTRYLTMADLRAKHEPRMHPEFARRFFAYLEHKQGLLGVGGGYRITQPDKPGFAPDGKSFHQLQEWASGIDGYAAIDLVTKDGPDVDDRHDGVTWAMTEDAPDWGLHTFITGEPWHIQPVEIRGWQGWVNQGRRDPQRFQLPGEGVDMSELIYAGIDWNGKDYNNYDDPNAWIIPASGGGLVVQPDLSVRCASIRNDEVIIGAHNGYMRPQTTRTFTVPFEVSGEVFIHERLDNVTLIPSGNPPHWTWAFNVLPVFVDEDNNIVTGFAPESPNWSASGQIDKKYGIARAERYTPPFNHDDQIGAWHRWLVRVPAVGTHEVYWDDKLVYRVVEKTPPAKWWDRPLKVALRFDFYDVSLRFNPTTPPPITPPEGAPEMFMFVVTNAPDSDTPETWLLCDGTQLSHVVDGHAAAVYAAAGVSVVRSDGADQTRGLIKSCRTMTDSPPEWAGTGWQNLWNASR